MSAARTGRLGSRRRTLRRLAPVVIALVRTLEQQRGETVTLTVTAAAATAIARATARRTQTIGDLALHPAHDAVRAPVTLPRTTAEQWRRDAWQAVRDGRLDVADAEHLSDQLQRPGAA